MDRETPAEEMDAETREPAVADEADPDEADPGDASSVVKGAVLDEEASPGIAVDEDAEAPIPPEAALPGPSRPAPEVAVVLAWLIPGAGHAYAGSRGRAVLYFLLISLTTLWGQLVLGGRAVGLALETSSWVFLAQLGTGLYTLGPVLGARFLGVPGPLEVEVVVEDVVAHIDLGLYFTMLAGVLNLVVAQDALERALASGPDAPAAEAGSEEEAET